MHVAAKAEVRIFLVMLDAGAASAQGSAHFFLVITEARNEAYTRQNYTPHAATPFSQPGDRYTNSEQPAIAIL